ncbi:MAG: tryptophan synthase subunit alpha [Gammaproteobacteria bacterium]
MAVHKLKRISETFSDLAERNNKALVVYVVAGDPDFEASLRVLHSCCEAGADILELGIPFSDPMSEGVTIQQGHERALQGGMTQDRLFDLVQAFRADNTHTPIVLMGYINTLLSPGIAQFSRRAAEVGVDGLLIVDLPVEQIAQLDPAREAGLDTVLLASPTTDATRFRQIAAAGSGYLYYVSYAGVTGDGQLDISAVQSKMRKFDLDIDIPLAIGFGIKTAEQAAALSPLADAIVVGSAAVNFCGQQPVDYARLKAFIASIKAALC